MKNLFTCVFIIIGTVIGAGFASGQEVVSFFNRYDTYGVYGLIVSCALFRNYIDSTT